MNGEIPSIPITTLAGMASLTDLIPELPLPTPLPSTMNNQSLLFHPKIADEAKSILQTCDDTLISQLVDVLNQTSTEHLELKDMLACNTIEGSIPELLKGILRKDRNVFHGSIDARDITADLTPSAYLMQTNHAMSPYGATPPGYNHHTANRGQTYSSPLYTPGSTINGDCRLMEEAVAPNHYSQHVKASPAHATAAEPSAHHQISPAHNQISPAHNQVSPAFHQSPRPDPIIHALPRRSPQSQSKSHSSSHRSPSHSYTSQSPHYPTTQHSSQHPSQHSSPHQSVPLASHQSPHHYTAQISHTRQSPHHAPQHTPQQTSRLEAAPQPSHHQSSPQHSIKQPHSSSHQSIPHQSTSNQPHQSTSHKPHKSPSHHSSSHRTTSDPSTSQTKHKSPHRSPHHSSHQQISHQSHQSKQTLSESSSHRKPIVVLEPLDQQVLKSLNKPKATSPIASSSSNQSHNSLSAQDRTLTLKLTRLKLPDGDSSVSVRGLKRDYDPSEFTPSLSERVKRRRRQSPPPPTPVKDWSEMSTEEPQMSYNFARNKEKKKKKSTRHVLCTEELLESPMFKKFTTELENALENLEQVDLNAIDLNDAECECPSEILLGKSTISELCGEAAKLRSQSCLNQIPVDKLVKLLTVLMWNIKDGSQLTLHIPQDDDEDDSELWRELMMERVMRSMDAALTSMHIMTSPNMPKKVYLEDVIERVNQFTKFQLHHTIYPEFDPVYRVDPRAKDGYQGNLKQKRARAGQVKNKLTLLLYNKLTELISGMSVLTGIQELTDTSILQLSSLGVSTFFVENISELQLTAMKLVTSIFSRYGKHRQLILEDIFASLARLPSSKRNLRNFRLSATESIQMVTALALQFIHCVVRLPSQDGSDLQDESNPMDNDEFIVTSYETAISTGHTFLSVFLQKCTTKGDDDYRPLFENFVLDLLTTVNKPEWPAVELLLSLLGRILVKQFSNKSTDMSLRTASLEYLGIVAARLRKDAVTSHLKQETIDHIIHKVTGTPSSDDDSSSTEVENDDTDDERGEGERVKKPKKKRKKHSSGHSDLSDQTETLQTAMLDYLAYNGQSEPALLFARQFYVAQWYRDTTMAVEKSKDQQSKSSEVKDHDHESDFEAAEEEMTTAISQNAEKHKAFLLSCIHCNVTPFSSFKPNPSKLAYEDACFVARYLSSHRPFSQSFDIYLTQILRVLSETVVAVRTKAMKCLTAVVEADPGILARSDMRKGVHGRFLDNSTSVREAAVELVGKFILIRHELISEYYEMLSVRILDTGISVRKRVIKIFRDICIDVPDFPKVPEMCVKMIRRVNDEEGIKKLVNDVFHVMWFSPLHLRNKEEEKAKLLLRVVNITDVVAASKESGLDFFEQLLNNLLKDTDQDGRHQDKDTAISKQVLESCKQIVDCLVENVLRIEEKTVELTGGKSVSSQRLIACLSTLHLFSKIKPQIMVKHAMTLEPYLNIRCSTLGDSNVIHYVARILELVVPLMDHPSESFLAQLEENIAKLVVQNGMQVVESCVSCLGAVTNNVTHNYELVRHCATRFMSALVRAMTFFKEDPTYTPPPSHKPQILRSLFTVGLMCKHFDMDRKEISEGKASVRDKVYELMLYFIGNDNEEIRHKAIMGLGFLCIRYYDLMMTKRVKELYDELLTNQFSSVKLKCQVLKNLENYLYEEEEKMSKADHEWRKTGKKEDLKEMGDVQSGMASTIMQIYLQQTLESFFHTMSNVRVSALSVIALVLNQGLVHPVQCVPYLVCMSTDTESQVRTKADQQLAEIEKKYPGFIYMKALMGIKMSFRLQRLLQDPSTTLRGYREDDMGCMSLNTNLYTMLRSSRSQRRTFITQLLSTFDDSSTCGLDEQIFIADNIAFFPYTLQDEPLYLINQIDLIVSVSGSNIIQNFRENLLPKAGQPAGQPEEPVTVEEDDEDDDVQALADRIPDDASSLVNALRVSQGCVLLLHLKQHLKDLYGFTDTKVHKYSPTESAKVYDKPLSRRPSVRFNPTPVITALEEGTPKICNPVEYHERFKIIDEFIDFKQLMLSVDPPDEDDEDDTPTKQRHPSMPTSVRQEGEEGMEGDDDAPVQPEVLMPLADDVPELTPVNVQPRTTPSHHTPTHHTPTHHTPTHHSSSHHSSHHTSHHKPSSRLPQPYKPIPSQHKKSHRAPKPAPRLTTKTLKKKKKKRRQYSGSGIDSSSDDYDDDPDFAC